MHSRHFSESELTCKCGCGLNAATPELLELIEACRAILNTPMVVRSATRCEKHNTASGGVKNSKHVSGNALDFYVTGLAPAVVFKVLKSWHEAGRLPQLGGIGLYDWGVHVDTFHAPDGHLRSWDYRKEKKR